VGADPSFFRVVKFAIEKSDGVTAVSRYLRDRTIEEFGIGREIRVIPNFIEAERPEANRGLCSRPAFAPNGEMILMHASNFRPVKRIGDVVRVFARVRERIPAKLLLIGEGPERIFIQQLVRELKLGPDVHFLANRISSSRSFSAPISFSCPASRKASA